MPLILGSKIKLQCLDVFQRRTFIISLNSKFRPNDCNSWTQHILTLSAQHSKAPAKRSQTVNATYPNIVRRNMLRAFGHPVATCCAILYIENRTSTRARSKHCWTDLAKRLQHHATSTNVAWKMWPFSNSSKQHRTCHKLSQHSDQTYQTCYPEQCFDMLRWHVAIVWPGLNVKFEKLLY